MELQLTDIQALFRINAKITLIFTDGTIFSAMGSDENDKKPEVDKIGTRFKVETPNWKITIPCKVDMVIIGDLKPALGIQLANQQEK